MKTVGVIVLAFAAFAVAEQKEVETAGASLSCNICQKGVEYLRENAPVVEEQLEQALHSLCDKLPAAPLVTKCKSTVDLYLNKTLAFIQTDETAEQWCTRYQMCKGTGAKGPTVCERLQEIYNNMDAVLDTVVEQCSVLQDEALVAQCKKLITDNRPALKEKLQQTLKQIARILPFIGQEYCLLGDPTQFAMEEAKDINVKIYFSALQQKAAGPNVYLCIFCEQSFIYIRDTLFSTEFVDALIGALEKLCQNIGSPAGQAQCVTAIDTYVRTGIGLIKEEIDQVKICTLIGACAKVPTTVAPRL